MGQNSYSSHGLVVKRITSNDEILGSTPSVSISFFVFSFSTLFRHALRRLSSSVFVQRNMIRCAKLAGEKLFFFAMSYHQYTPRDNLQVTLHRHRLPQLAIPGITVPV